GQLSSVVTASPEARSATPRPTVHEPRPGTQTPAAAPGTPWAAIVSSSAARSRPRSASGSSPAGASGRTTGVGSGVSDPLGPTQPQASIPTITTTVASTGAAVRRPVLATARSLVDTDTGPASPTAGRLARDEAASGRPEPT